MEVVHEHEQIDDEAEAESKGGAEILVVSDGGTGKRSFVSTYRRTKRGAKGVTSIKLKENEKVVSALQITAGDELLLTTEKGQTV